MAGKKLVTSKRFDSLHKTYLKAYIKKQQEASKTANEIIQDAKFNLKLECAQRPRKRENQLNLFDLLNVTMLCKSCDDL